MKKVVFVLVFGLAVCAQGVAASPQTNNIVPAITDAANTTTTTEESQKKGKPRKSNKTTKNPANDQSKQQADAPAPQADTTTVASVPVSTTVPAESDDSAAKTETPAKNDSSVKTDPPAKTETAPTPRPPTEIYRVGVGDILDIRLLNAQTRESTLFTVMPGGLLEYPLAGEALQVAGLTTDEIDARLTEKIKLYENPQVVVSVREYVSHTVVVAGLVNEPGTKALRREAMPLYVVLAEAQPRPEAGLATIVKADGQNVTVNLTDAKATTTLVHPGDVVTISAPPPAPPQFYYIGGQVNSPGQKDFHEGLTLTQAVLASGGTTRFASSKVKVSRAGADGRLTTTEYNLKHIETGKIPDPVLQAGDRLEVGRSGW